MHHKHRISYFIGDIPKYTMPTNVRKCLLDNFYLQGENISKFRTNGTDGKVASAYT